MKPLLSLRDVDVKLNTASGPLHVVRGVSLDVMPGETLCIVGESGCGKSMLSLAIMDLLPTRATRHAQRIELSGNSLKDLTDRQMADLRGAKVSMIFQEPMTSLNPVFTIGEQLVETYVRHRGGTAAVARHRAAELLESVGISGAERRLRQYPHQLSGGLRQRVMIAMALICEPELLIADEPTTALDVTIQMQILKLLADIQVEFRMAMILVTHDLGVVSRVADRVAVMYAGTVVEEAPVDKLFAEPMHPYTQGLLSCLPASNRTRPKEHLGSIPGTVPSLLGGIEGCGFRTRCPIATAACGVGQIERREHAEAHTYACIAGSDRLSAGGLWAGVMQS